VLRREETGRRGEVTFLFVFFVLRPPLRLTFFGLIDTALPLPPPLLLLAAEAVTAEELPEDMEMLPLLRERDERV
jgi:hypothetical protein